MILIKLIEKKGSDKRFIKKQRPISLLNVDLKITSKVEKLKKFYQIKNRHVDESGRLISDVIEIAKIKNWKVFY